MATPLDCGWIWVRKGSKRQVYLRTAVSVEKDGWAHDYVTMPDYRWGIFLTPLTRTERLVSDYMG